MTCWQKIIFRCSFVFSWIQLKVFSLSLSFGHHISDHSQIYYRYYYYCCCCGYRWCKQARWAPKWWWMNGKRQTNASLDNGEWLASPKQKYWMNEWIEDHGNEDDENIKKIKDVLTLTAPKERKSHTHTHKQKDHMKL